MLTSNFALFGQNVEKVHPLQNVTLNQNQYSANRSISLTNLILNDRNISRTPSAGKVGSREKKINNPNDNSNGSLHAPKYDRL